VFPGYGWEAYPAGVRFPVKREEVNLMKKNLRGKIREYIQSEDGRVGIKSPLALGAAVGSVLLAQAIIGTTPAHAWQCRAEFGNADCDPGEICDGPHIWNGHHHIGTCHD